MDLNETASLRRLMIARYRPQRPSKAHFEAQAARALDCACRAAVLAALAAVWRVAVTRERLKPSS